MGINKLEGEICQKAMEGFLKGIGAARLQSVDQIKIKGDVLLKLLSLTVVEREALVDVANQFVKVDIDIEALDRQLNHICNHANGDKLENEFLMLGAPVSMMRELFGMHATEFSQRRNALGLKGENRGRPKVNNDAELAIWDIWYQLRDVELRERYLKAAELTGENLLSVWTAVKKYNLYEMKKKPAMSAVCRSVA